jgi:hypothetical protein
VHLSNISKKLIFNKKMIMKKSIQLLLPFILFLGIANTATAQSDATFEEAINFTINNIVVDRYTGEGYSKKFKLEIDSIGVNRLEFTFHYYKDFGKLLYYKRTYSWSMTNISEVTIKEDEDNYYYVILKCDTGKHPEGCIIKTVYKNGKFGLDWESTGLENTVYLTVTTEEMAQRVKKALDHARKLAGAKDEKF